MVSEVLEHLALSPGGVAVDGTVGGGGHTRRLCEQVGPRGRVIGLDRDPEALAEAGRGLAEFGDRLSLVQANFARLGIVLDGLAIEKIDSVLLDLGPSSRQLTGAERGFGFGRDGPLDMRMDPAEARGAKELLMELTLADLERHFRRAGEARWARPLARAVIRRREEGRPLQTTGELKRLVEETIPRRDWPREIHPATRVFLALRLLVNQELESLADGLAQAADRLNPGGRVAALTYHSLEDGLVKRFFQDEAKGCVCPPALPVCRCGRQPRLRVITRRPVGPSAEEIARNPRARSAKLRAAERLAGENQPGVER